MINLCCVVAFEMKEQLVNMILMFVLLLFETESYCSRLNPEKLCLGRIPAKNCGYLAMFWEK